MKHLTIAAMALLALGACREEAAEILPAPVAMTEDALGHFCQMALLEHPGPKAQVHLDGAPAPLFFSQVRDAIAYQRMPEQSHAIVAIYVSDMAVAPGWDQPGAENWIDARTAHYVVGSQVTGGMGAPELVPFSDASAAQEFADRQGGTVLMLTDIDDAEVLTPVAVDGQPDTADAAEDDAEYLERLRNLGGN